MYLTYQEYTELGFEKVSQEKFDVLEKEAVQLLRYRSMNKTDKGILEGFAVEIKECTCRLVDNFQERNIALSEIEKGISISRQGISSESVTDHKVSFHKLDTSDFNAVVSNYNLEAIEIIKRSLLWTGLLYRGI